MNKTLKYSLIVVGLLLIAFAIYSCRAGKPNNERTMKNGGTVDSSRVVKKADTTSRQGQAPANYNFCHSTKVIDGVTYTLQSIAYAPQIPSQWIGIYTGLDPKGNGQNYLEKDIPVTQQFADEYHKKCGY